MAVSLSIFLCPLFHYLPKVTFRKLSDVTTTSPIFPAKLASRPPIRSLESNKLLVNARLRLCWRVVLTARGLSQPRLVPQVPSASFERNYSIYSGFHWLYGNQQALRSDIIVFNLLIIRWEGGGAVQLDGILFSFYIAPEICHNFCCYWGME